MADLGDLTDFILEGGEREERTSTLSDLEWLYPDMDEYRKTQVLPKQNLDSIPELEEQWRYLDDSDRYRLSPENRRPSRPNTPFWSERPSNDLDDIERIAIVEQFLRSHLQDGVVASTALKLVKKHFDRDTLKLATPTIKEALSERGLLGSVYIDATLFPKCASGQGQQQVLKKNRAASFVLAKDACHGCRWAQDNHCARFEKRLVFDVEDIAYTPEMWQKYKQKALSEGKDLSSITSSMTNKEKVRTANLSGYSTHDSLDSKPVQKDFGADVTPEEAEAGLRAAEVQREVVANYRLDQKLRRYAMRMMHEEHGPELRDAILTDPDLETLKPDLYLMGHLYANLAYFDSREAANLYVQSHPHVIPFGSPEGSRIASEPFSLHRTDVVSQIIHRYALQRYGYDYDQDLMLKLARRLYTMEDFDLRKFARSVYNKPIPEAIRKYDVVSPVIYDPAKGITSREAHQKLREFDLQRIVVEDQNLARKKKAFLKLMALGHRSEELKERIATEGFNDLLLHWNLHGKEYLLTDMFSPKEVTALVRRRACLKHMPHVSIEDISSHMKTASFKSRILNRYASLESQEGRQVTASFRNRFASLEGEHLLEFANAVFGQDLRSDTLMYQSNQKTQANLDVEAGSRFFSEDLYVRSETPYEPTVQDISDFKSRLMATEQEVVSKSLAYLSKKEGGRKLVGLMAARFTPEVVANVYFPNTKASSGLKNASMRKAQEEEILRTVLDPEFKPMEVESTVMPQFFETQVGRWLRDEISQGSGGEDLSSKLAANLSHDQLVTFAPMILSLREEEGLLGRSYVRADSYRDCKEGKKATSTSVSHVVQASKCSGCIYNRSGKCMLYAKPLTDAPRYDDDTLRKALAHRMTKGQLTKEDAEFILDLSLSARELTRKAHTMRSQRRTHMAKGDYHGHFGSALEQGQAEKKVVSMLKRARTLLLNNQASSKSDMLSTLTEEFGTSVVKMGSVYLDQVYERTTFNMEDHVDAVNINATTGYQQMSEMELTSTQVINPYADLDLEDKKDEAPVDISFGGFTE